MPRTACLERLRTGGLVLVVDSALEPPEAALVCAAARVTPEAINLMTLHTRGLVCLALPRERMRRLGIPLLVPDRGGTKPAYGVSIEACRGVSTGISAADRTATVLAAVAPDATPADLVMPGHVTPIEITPEARSSARRCPRRRATSCASPPTRPRRSTARCWGPTATSRAQTSSPRSLPGSACRPSR